METAISLGFETDNARREATRVLRWGAEAIRERGVFRIALAGGADLRPLLAAIAEESRHTEAAFDRWHVFWCEERHVPPYHLESCYRLAEQALLGRVPVLPENLHRIRAEYRDPHEAARSYELLLRRTFSMSPGELPRFDVVVLGGGSKGTVIRLTGAILSVAGHVLAWGDAAPLPALPSLAGVSLGAA